MSIFDRFWGTAKKTDALAPGPAATGVQPAPTAVDRRSRKRKNARKGAKALIIDDSPTVVAVLRKILRSAGYTTSEAGDAESGLMLMQQDVPDLVFLDIILPGMNGFGALRAIRKDPATQHVPVIMISGNEHATEQFYANRIGADDFMKKPFSRFEVFARIETLLDANRIPRRKTDLAAAPTPAPAAAAAQPSASVPGTAGQDIGTNVAQAPQAPRPGAWSALDARKELTAMGLQYFDQNQFFAAIHRGDQLAVELYVAAGGVALDEPLNGQTARDLATAMGRTALAQLLTAAARARTPGSP